MNANKKEKWKIPRRHISQSFTEYKQNSMTLKTASGEKRPLKSKYFAFGSHIAPFETISTSVTRSKDVQRPVTKPIRAKTAYKTMRKVMPYTERKMRTICYPPKRTLRWSLGFDRKETLRTQYSQFSTNAKNVKRDLAHFPVCQVIFLVNDKGPLLSGSAKKPTKPKDYGNYCNNMIYGKNKEMTKSMDWKHKSILLSREFSKTNNSNGTIRPNTEQLSLFSKLKMRSPSYCSEDDLIRIVPCGQPCCKLTKTPSISAKTNEICIKGRLRPHRRNVECNPMLAIRKQDKLKRSLY